MAEAKRMTEAMKDEKEKQVESKEAKQVVAETMPQENAKGVQFITLPELVGQITTRILIALDGQDQGEKGVVVSAARKDLRLWYEAQSVENRKEVAKSARKTIENFKSVSEQLWSDIGFLTAQDL